MYGLKFSVSWFEIIVRTPAFTFLSYSKKRFFLPKYIFKKFYSGLECRAVTPRGLAATASTRTERSEGEGLPGRPQESIRSERKDTDLGNRSFI